MTPLRTTFLRAKSSLSHRRKLISAVSGQVVVGSNLTIGKRCRIWAPRSLTIGNGVWIGSDVRIEVDGIIADGVLIANRVGIVGRTDHKLNDLGQPITHATWVGDNPRDLSQPVKIESDVWVGYGSIILSGVTVGASSVVGAGAVVTKDVPPNTIVVGNPARPIGTRLSTSDLHKHWDMLRALGLPV